ncbi:MAG: carbon starvation protein A [Candidatus Delongbacteria bacterium]|nr:carbon starvation protein A [Candidatus Delongbacteria bacterium]
MNVLILFLISAGLFYLGYRYYASFIERTFEVDGTHVTPAVEINDGVDYVPTRKFVIFGHHFASIAGGGPIIGPTVAMIFGYLPVWLWILIGTLLMGTVHDFSALLASMRENGRSIARIAQSTLGRSGFLMFMGFTIIMLLMLTSVFLTLTTTALSSKYPVSYFGSAHLPIKTAVENGVTYAVIGGIASTSVIIITLFAPLIGWLLYKKKAKTLQVSLLSIAICLLSIPIGFHFPIHINSTLWMIIISIYTLIAAGIPVWIILQPRDFTNSFLLYGGLGVMIIGTIISGFNGTTMLAPISNIADGNAHLGYVWPILFITVACGAISGFHSLVAGGTTSKQVEKEKPDAKTVAFGGMVLESLLAIGVMIAIGVGLPFDQYTALVFPVDPSIKSNPILAFALGIGGFVNKSFGWPMVYGTIFGILMVEGFVVTTLDTAVRLNRYLFEELWSMLFKKVPKLMSTYIFNSLICVVLMFFLAYFNAFKHLWQLFGSANQLLAALTLLTVGLWLMKKGRRYFFAILPGLFMLATTLAALFLVLFKDYLPRHNIVLSLGDMILIGLAIGVIILGIRTFRNTKHILATTDQQPENRIHGKNITTK